MLSANPSLTPSEVYQIMRDTAVDVETPGMDFRSGYGYLDALEAMKNALPEQASGNDNWDIYE